MPTEMSSWADEIDETDTSLILPPPSEKWVGNQKITTEYSHNDEGKKVRIIRTFKIEKKLVSKSVAKRKALPKFGMSRNDRPGPDSATTVIGDEVLVNFILNKEEHEKDSSESSGLQKLGDENRSIFKCRICKENHMTSRCPYKDTHGALRESLFGIEKSNETGKNDGNSEVSKSGLTSTGTGTGASDSAGKYIPPSLRGAAEGRVGTTMPERKRDTDTHTLRVSNLSEFSEESDLHDLFGKFGAIQRIFLAKDAKDATKCKGFAFINYHKRDDALKAIATLNGFGYDHLILNVEWANKNT